nr:hypothetical protein Iba_chr09fCG13460 [Ipomoea batatas]GMD86538.1 hypothetical protein Iba_chr14bCG7000 [Ipomoea batatas]
MPEGNVEFLGIRLPWSSRLISAQQSSIFTYLYPNLARPVETRASAVCFMIFSSMLQPK